MAGTWVDQSDLANIMSVATFAAIFDDATTGVTNNDIVASVIERGEQEVLSWLVNQFGPEVRNEPGLAGDRFLKGCALEFCIVYAFDRYPEYVKANGKERQDRFDRAQKRMERVMQSRQRPTSFPVTPANVGGVNFDNGHPIYVDGPGGQRNAGDY